MGQNQRLLIDFKLKLDSSFFIIMIKQEGWWVQPERILPLLEEIMEWGRAWWGQACNRREAITSMPSKSNACFHGYHNQGLVLGDL
jgi:hypothetical protein